MGYEVRMKIGNVSSSGFISSIAEVDLCKIGDDRIDQLVQDSQNPEKNISGKPVYFYGADGNTQITEDRYGKRMYPVSAKVVLNTFKKEMKENKESAEYRRYKMALVLLESVVKNFSKKLNSYDHPYVIFFGH